MNTVILAFAVFGFVCFMFLLGVLCYIGLQLVTGRGK